MWTRTTEEQGEKHEVSDSRKPLSIPSQSIPGGVDHPPGDNNSYFLNMNDASEMLELPLFNF